MPTFTKGATLRASALLVAGTFGLAACGNAVRGDATAGRQAFKAKCSACHMLAGAGSTGLLGPNLDDAFRGARTSGFKESAFEATVLKWIAIAPQRGPRVDPGNITGPSGTYMPRNLAVGQEAADIAAFVAKVAGTGAGAAASLIPIPKGVVNPDPPPIVPTPPPSAPPASGGLTGGTVTIAADPTGAAKFTTDSLDAAAGALTFTFTNASATPHSFAIRGNGITPVVGDTVKDGASATLKAELKPGVYDFYSAVDGDEAAGMKGTLTVTDATAQGQASPSTKGPRIVGPWLRRPLRDRRIARLKPATRGKSAPVDKYSLPGFWIRINP